MVDNIHEQGCQELFTNDTRTTICLFVQSDLISIKRFVRQIFDPYSQIRLTVAKYLGNLLVF